MYLHSRSLEWISRTSEWKTSPSCCRPREALSLPFNSQCSSICFTYKSFINQSSFESSSLASLPGIWQSPSAFCVCLRRAKEGMSSLTFTWGSRPSSNSSSHILSKPLGPCPLFPDLLATSRHLSPTPSSPHNATHEEESWMTRRKLFFGFWFSHLK